MNLLRRFVSERSKIRARRVNGNSTQQQKLVADAVKVAREMALIPYATRITTQRNNRGRDGERGDRGDRGPRAEGPAPRPSGPPPGADEVAPSLRWASADIRRNEFKGGGGASAGGGGGRSVPNEAPPAYDMDEEPF